MHSHSDFVHLHVHTQYSLLDGACQLDALLAQAKHFHMPALAITDHGNMFGAVEFYIKARAQGIKPLIGCEVYVAPGSRKDKKGAKEEESMHHLLLLARNEEGYHNLIRLVSGANTEGFYYKPRIDKEILAQYHAGLLGMSACLKGEIGMYCLADKMQEAQKVAGIYQDILGKENFYLELMDHGLAEQKRANPRIIALAKKVDAPLIWTNDVHYIERAHAYAHEALLCIQTQTTMNDPKRMRFSTEEFYLKSPEEMKQISKECPQGFCNTLDIAHRCNVELDFRKTYLPHFEPPKGKTHEAYFCELVEEGLKKRYPHITDAIRQRVTHEIETIRKSGYISYFLITHDFVCYAKQKDIPVGPGRGSAAGSVVSYALGITDLDPLKNDLLFERFLNPDRVSMPDIDIDFCYERRNEVIDYVIQKYGKENVAQIVTFGTMGAKAVIRDVARVMGIAYQEADRIAKLVPSDLNITLDQALVQEPKLQALVKDNLQMQQLIDISKTLEGLTRHASVHAAGVVISQKPLSEHIPLYRAAENQITTGYTMEMLEKVGLLKMDFLGLRTLTVIDQTIKILKRTQKIDLDIQQIPWDDKKTFAMLQDAETFGVFQLESSGMRDLVKKLKPELFEDLTALLALFRPGPLGSGMVEDFIKRKHKKIPVVYDHPLLEPILQNTYGVILYQEQVMRIVSSLAGFSLSQADLLRRAIGKKVPEIMEEQRQLFIQGCSNNTIPEKISKKIFDMIEYFAGYGFNKSHSAAYAVISYRTAYLKAHYPVEFMCALLTSERDNTDKIGVYIKEAKRMGINVLPPDVNESFGNFTVVGSDIRFGLSALKNVGEGSVEGIIQARTQKGRFTAFLDFFQKVDHKSVNRKVVESLIKAGAFDTFGLFRAQCFEVIDKMLEYAAAAHRDKQSGQFSFFDDAHAGFGSQKEPVRIPRIPEWPESQLLAYEKEVLGLYVSRHPLVQYARIMRVYSTCAIQDLIRGKDAEEVCIGGIIGKYRQTVTKKKNEKMAIVTLEDLEASCDVLVFPKVFAECESLLGPDRLIWVKGKIDKKEESPKIMASSIYAFEHIPDQEQKGAVLEMSEEDIEQGKAEKLKEIICRYPGKMQMQIFLKTKNNTKVNISSSSKFSIQLTEEMIQEIEELLGEGVIQAR